MRKEVELIQFVSNLLDNFMCERDAHICANILCDPSFILLMLGILILIRMYVYHKETFFNLLVRVLYVFILYGVLHNVGKVI